jgi:enoyl-CoA hydratase/carnithine racemase
MSAEGGHVRVERDGPVGIVTLDRPDVLNAFSGIMGEGLERAYRDFDADETIRAVVLTGAGRAFCAGADFSGGSAVFGSQEGKDDFSADPFRFHAWDVRKPVIAAVNGHAVGIGLTMTLHCDLRFVAEDAKLGIVQNRRGVMPDLRSHWTLPRLVGHGRATELLLTGRMFTGADAARWGLATEAVPAPEVLPRALAVAHEIATHVAPVSVAVSKRLLWADPLPSGAEIERLETDLHRHLMGREDAREGVMAFMEKRSPSWTMTLTEDWPDWLDERTRRRQ